MDQKQMNMDDAVFDFVFQMALSDATRRVAENTDKELGGEQVKKIVKNYVEAVIKGNDNPDFNSAIEEIQKINKEFTFGKIQKLINMTMKYMYIKYYDDTDSIICFQSCDAPLDSLMKDFVYESFIYLSLGDKPGFRKDLAWSKMTNKADYSSFQNAVKKIMDYADTQGFKIQNKMEFDYMFWDKAKALRDKKKEEQTRIITDIWTKIGVAPK